MGSFKIKKGEVESNLGGHTGKLKEKGALVYLRADGLPLPVSPFGDVHWELPGPSGIPLEARDR